MSRTANGCTTRGSDIVRELKASIELDAGRLERARAMKGDTVIATTPPPADAMIRFDGGAGDRNECLTKQR